jgi:opacity protein-like surface antigen
MRTLSSLLLAGAALLVAQSAFAADLRPTVLPPDQPMLPVVNGSDSGWYLRGDVGIGMTSLSGFSVVPSGAFNTLDIRGSSVSEQSFVALGVGYQHSFLRFDVTGELRGGARIRGTDFVTYNAGGGGIGNLTNVYDGDLRTWLAMANVYADLGTFCHLGCLTPYVGVGFGYAYHQVSNFTDQGSGFISGGTGGPISPNGATGAGSKGSFAWSVMAGLGYKVSERLTLDVGYRYLNMGDGPDVVLIGNATGASPGTVRTGSFDSHDIKVGMRWALNHDCCAQPVPEAPVVRKY